MYLTLHPSSFDKLVIVLAIKSCSFDNDLWFCKATITSKIGIRENSFFSFNKLESISTNISSSKLVQKSLRRTASSFLTTVELSFENFLNNLCKLILLF